MTSILFRGPAGLGDAIYIRAAIRELIGRVDLYLETPWPQLVADLPIKCVRRRISLRTQEKNAARDGLVWYVPPSGIRQQRVSYLGAAGTIMEGLYASLGIRPAEITFDLPAFAPWPVKRPYVVIRPATVRAEARYGARNPLPEYLAMAAEKLRAHFRIVSVADLAPNIEWPLLPLPYADETFHAGEIQVEQLLALVAGAAGVVAGVGWAVPAAVAYRVPLFLIYGGGVNDSRARIFDTRMPTENVHHAIPDRFCKCSDRNHACDKRIASIDQQLDEWIMGLRARRSTVLAA